MHIPALKSASIARLMRLFREVFWPEIWHWWRTWHFILTGGFCACLKWRADALQWLVDDVITDIACLTGNVGGSEIQNEDAACVSFRMGNVRIYSWRTHFQQTSFFAWFDRFSGADFRHYVLSGAYGSIKCWLLRYELKSLVFFCQFLWLIFRVDCDSDWRG